MYFPTGSFSEAEAMMWGWNIGAHTCIRDALSDWDRFYYWYAVKYPGLGANSIFGVIAAKYPDEPARFRRLLFLFNKYMRETTALESE